MLMGWVQGSVAVWSAGAAVTLDALVLSVGVRQAPCLTSPMDPYNLTQLLEHVKEDNVVKIIIDRVSPASCK